MELYSNTLTNVTENELKEESERLGKLLKEGKLTIEQALRLRDIKDMLESFEKLKQQL